MPASAARRANDATSAGSVSQIPRSVPAGSGPPLLRLDGIEQGGRPRRQCPVGEELQPAEPGAAAGRADRVPAPELHRRRSRELFRPDRGMDPDRQVAALVEDAIRVDRPAQPFLERERARIMDGDHAEPDEVTCQTADRLLVLSRRGLGTRSVTSRAAASWRTPVAAPSASRRIRPPGGSARSRSMPAWARAGWLTRRAWWSWAQRATERPGATRCEIVGGGPDAPAIVVPAVALEPGVLVSECRVSSRDPGEAIVERGARGQVDPVKRNPALGQVEVGVGQARDRDLVGVRARSGACADRPASRARSRSPRRRPGRP